MKRRFRIWIVSMALAWLAAPSSASACAVCMGDPESKVTQGVVYSVLAMMGLIYSVIGGVIGFFVYVNKRASAEPGDSAPDAPGETH